MEKINLDELLNLTPTSILGESMIAGVEKLTSAVVQHDQELIAQIIVKETQLLDALEAIDQ